MKKQGCAIEQFSSQITLLFYLIFFKEERRWISFRFYEAWAEEEFCRDSVEKAWKMEVSGFHRWKLHMKTKEVARKLKT